MQKEMLIRVTIWGVVFAMLALVFLSKRTYSDETLDYWLPIASPFIGFAAGCVFGAILTKLLRAK
jgi:uncharacterized membrane protein